MIEKYTSAKVAHIKKQELRSLINDYRVLLALAKQGNTVVRGREPYVTYVSITTQMSCIRAQMKVVESELIHMGEDDGPGPYFYEN